MHVVPTGQSDGANWTRVNWSVLQEPLVGRTHCFCGPSPVAPSGPPPPPPPVSAESKPTRPQLASAAATSVATTPRKVRVRRTAQQRVASRRVDRTLPSLHGLRRGY